MVSPIFAWLPATLSGAAGSLNRSGQMKCGRRPQYQPVIRFESGVYRVNAFGEDIRVSETEAPFFFE
jgi:hypothetical protein